MYSYFQLFVQFQWSQKVSYENVSNWKNAYEYLSYITVKYSNMRKRADRAQHIFYLLRSLFDIRDVSSVYYDRL